MYKTHCVMCIMHCVIYKTHCIIYFSASIKQEHYEAATQKLPAAIKYTLMLVIPKTLLPLQTEL